MADTIDSISIELTANTQSAENSIQRVIDMLRMLQAAVIDASAESRIVKSIRSIAKAAKEVDTDAGQRLARLAGGLNALSKVGDLSNLADAGKNLSSVVRAVNGMGQTGGKGLSNLADGIRQTRDAMRGVNDADVSRLGAVRDALSGEMSGSLHTSAKTSESAALGGMGTPEPSFGNMAAYGAMTVFKFAADSIRDATMAYWEFAAALAQGGASVETQFSDSAMTVFRYTADSIRDATAAYREFQAALGSGAPPIFTNFADDAAQASASVRMLTGSVSGGNEGPWVADEIRDAARAYDDVRNSASRAADVIETEFANPFANYKMKPLEDELPRVTLNPIDDSVADSANNTASAFERLLSSLVRLSGSLGRVASGLASLGKAMFAIPKYFGGQLIGSIQKGTKAFTGLFNSIVRIAKYRLIRTALKLITQGINDGIKNLYNWSRMADQTFFKSMNTIATATQYLGNSFAAMVSPLINALAPAIDFIVDKFVDLFNFINQIIARLSGQTSYTAAKKVAAQWDDASKKSSGSAKKAADEIKRTILGFDEINKLSADSNKSGSGSGGGKGTDASTMFETLPIDGAVSSFADQLKAAIDASNWQELGELLGGKINELIDKIDFATAGKKVGEAINAWFTTEYWTLDAINFTNIGAKIAEFLNNAIEAINFETLGRLLVQKLGIIGDVIIGFFENFDWGQAASKLSYFVEGLFNEIAKWFSKYDWSEIGKAIADGIVDFLGNIDLSGIANSLYNAMSAVLEAAILSFTGFVDELAAKFKAAVNWDSLTDGLKAAITVGMALLGGALLVVGGILAFSGTNIPLGLGLMAAGAITLGVAASLAWNGLTDKVKGNIELIKGILFGAMLVIGAILTFSGAHIGLGLGLLVAGSIGLAGTIGANWDIITEKLQGPIGTITKLLSGATLVLGVLALIGGNPLLGLSLIIAGAGGLVTTFAAVDWDIEAWFNGIWSDIKAAAEATWGKLKEIGAGIWGKITEGITEKVSDIGAWIKEHIFKPFVNAWNWLLGLFGGGDDSSPSDDATQLAANAAMKGVTNNASVADDIARETTDNESIQKLKAIGATMANAIKNGLNDRLKNIASDIWDSIVKSWNAETRELTANVILNKSGWSSLANYVGTYDANVYVKLVKSGWSTLAKYVGTYDANVYVKLVRSGWSTLAKYVGTYEPNVYVKLVRSGWSSLEKYVGTYDANVYVKLVKSGWSSLANYVGTYDANVYVKLVKSGWSSLANYVGTYDANVYVKLVKSGWSTLAKYVGTYDANVYVKLVKSGWSTLAKYVGTYEPNVYVKLVKSGWSTLAKYVGTYDANVYVKLVRSGWSTLGKYVGTYTANVKVVLKKDGWTNISSYLDDNFGGASGGGGKTSGGGAGRYKVSIGLKDPTTKDTDNFWTRLGEAWNASVTAVDKGLDVVVRPVAKKAGGALSGFFSKVGEWLFGKSDTPETESKVKAVAGKGFSSVGNDGKMNLTGISDTNATIYLQQGNFSEGYKKWLTGDQYADLRSTVYLQNGNFKDGYKKWVTGDQYADLRSTVYLQNGNFKDGYKKWLTGNIWADVNSSVYLKNGNFSDGFKKWLTGNIWADVNSSVYLKAGNFKSLSSWLGDSVTVSVNLKAGGGVAYSNGYSASFASGGVISSGVARHLSNIPHYAGGTTDAHGTLFLAGEAGPEILGHVGGRTEILNQSQLASTMFAAVRSAMTGVKIGGYIENAVTSGDSDADYETMYRAMYDAFTDAMTGSNERDKEKVQLMRQIAAKEFTAEVTAASVNRAQTRMNRRAGTTIVPVGT